ncbi:MAG: FABP family protein [Cellulomonadaceae bacterium]|jgi:hypothetical protein|nr:FABP family protein [Cellulomonadaceae bacterium]
MAFTFPDGLAPEIYPLAWLVGRWQGSGVLDYPGIGKHTILSDIVFDHDGGPYLRYEHTIRVVNPPNNSLNGDDGEPVAIPDEKTDEQALAALGIETTPQLGEVDLDDTTIWSTETGYWRISTNPVEGIPVDQHLLEVLIVDASGRMAPYAGVSRPARIDIHSNHIIRTATAAEVTESVRMYGLVGGKLMWVEELAAFGHDLGNYASAELDRVED